MKQIMIKGVHNTGKTTTVTAVIKELIKRGYTVGSVKDIHFVGFAIDEEGTDTWKHAHAGATTVTARGLEETDIIHKKKLDLESILCQYDQDYLVIEGDPGAYCLNIVTGEKTEDLDERMDERTIAFSGIIGEKIQSYKGLPVLNNKKDIKKMVDLIEKEVKRMAEERKETEVKMYFDDKEVPMVPFVEAIIRGSIMGIAKELKGYEEGCEVKVVTK